MLAFGALVLLLVGSATAVVPVYSRVELVQDESGDMGSGDRERTILTQRGDSVFVAVNVWPTRDTELLTSRLPTRVYSTFWDSLVALGFFNLDSSYRGNAGLVGERDGHVTVECSTGSQTRRKRVAFRGNSDFPEKFESTLLLVSGMRVWGGLSVERLLDDTTDAAWNKLSDVLGFLFDPMSPVPEPVRYLLASNRSAEIVERIFDRAAKASIGRDYVRDLWGDERARWLALFLPKDEATVRKGLSRPEATVRILTLGAINFRNAPDIESTARRMTHDEALPVRLFAARVLAYKGKLHDASVLLEGLQAGRPWLGAVISSIIASGDSGAMDSLLSFALRSPPEVRGPLWSEDIGKKSLDPRVTTMLLQYFREAWVGLNPAYALDQIGFRASDTVLLDSIADFFRSDTGTWNRGFAAAAVVRLAQHNRPRSLRVLREALQRWPSDLSLVAAAGEVRDTALYVQFTLMAATGAPRLRAAATYALAHFETADARETMRSALAITPVDWYAVKAFYVWPDTQALGRLLQIAGDTSSSGMAQWSAVRALGKLGDPRAVPVLRNIADHGDDVQVSRAARDAIAEIKAPRTSGRRP
jgi:hypothetical protein